MPLQDAGGSSIDVGKIFGLTAPPPESPTAQATITTAPTLAAAPSSTPQPGQGVALTSGGLLPTSAKATGIRMLVQDPANALIGEFWFRTDLLKMSVMTSTGVKRSAAFS